MKTHVQHVVNAVEAEMPKIIKETQQRKKPIINEKMNQLTKHVEIPQLQIVGQFVGSGTAPVCQITQAEIGEVIEIGASIPAESASPMFVTAPGMIDRQVFEKLADDVVSEMRDLLGDLVHI